MRPDSGAPAFKCRFKRGKEKSGKLHFNKGKELCESRSNITKVELDLYCVNKKFIYGSSSQYNVSKKSAEKCPGNLI